MSKLVVAGCSFSDRYNVKNCYGDYLAKKLNREYVHEARSCGSNFAIWRSITNKIIDKEITQDDIVLIQYTEVTRTEFCSHVDPKPTANVKEMYDNNSYLIRYKIGSDEWHHNKKIANFLNTYTNNLLYDRYEFDKFKINDYNFQCMLEYNNINAYFIRVSLYSPEINENAPIFPINKYFKNRIFSEHQKYREHPYCFSNDDRFHLSEDGHQEIACDLYNFLKETNEF